MKKWLIFFSVLCFSHMAFAELPPLRVAIPAFSPPFVMQSAKNQFNGFDIATIEYICKTLKRRCEYIPTDFKNLLPSLNAQKADVAIGGIIITVKRSKKINFSIPYLTSEAQFITTDKTHIKQPFKLSQLADQRIGILADGAFRRSIRLLDIKELALVSFKQDSALVHALNTNQITLALLTVPKANYWGSNSSHLFKPAGKPFPIGFGFAIAVSSESAGLIKAINLAILDYQDDGEFKKNYNLYLKEGL
ncbi:MAG: transporter substrate-binding domain-containing protein [Gammaproteobacteria bacterium]|nr:transporter substrate-binding domain-containing protein [Gammaproteobacteria bacterium]